MFLTNQGFGLGESTMLSLERYLGPYMANYILGYLQMVIVRVE